MPRTNSRKRNNNRNDNSNRESENTNRVSVASSLSPNAPEFVPLTSTNDEIISNQRERLGILPMTFYGSAGASNSNGNDNNSNNFEATITTSIPDSISDKGQRDLLINCLNSAKVDCAICYEMTKNVEPIWNCRNCYQIMHLKCIMVWFIKSHRNAAWRCPHCQNEVVGKPTYVCFCGALPNPFSNSVDTPHSCGQVCGLVKSNSNAQYNDCHHKCTLLCHPGPCPQCVVQVLRKCGCGKIQVYAQCGQTDPIVCQNVCSKELNCKNHVCEKQCHAGNCEHCKKHSPQIINRNNMMLELPPTMERILESFRPQPRIPLASYVTVEELRMLGLNPEELLNARNENEDHNMDGYFDDSSSGSSILDGSGNSMGIFDESYDYDSEDEEEFDDEDEDRLLDRHSQMSLFTELLHATSRAERRRSAILPSSTNTLNDRLINALSGQSNIVRTSSFSGESSSSSDSNASTDHEDSGSSGSEIRNNSVHDDNSDHNQSTSVAANNDSYDEGDSENDMEISSVEESDLNDHSSSSWYEHSSDNGTNAMSSSSQSSFEDNSSYILSQSSISSLDSSNFSGTSDSSSSSF